MTIEEDVPRTKQALKNYLMYAESQLKENELNIKRLIKRLELAQERLAKFKEDRK